MSTVTMSLYEALTQVKVLKSRVDKIRSHRLVVVRKMDEDVDEKGIKLEDILTTSIRPAYQESVALMKNLIALKAAINDANSKTMIEVDGVEYSIANAMVLYRNTDALINLYQRMVGNYQAVEEEAARLNTRYQSQDALNAFLTASLGDGKRDADLVEKLTKSFYARNSYGVYDPLNTKEVAQKEIDRLEKFKNSVHYKLNQANINTMITVEFDD